VLRRSEAAGERSIAIVEGCNVPARDNGSGLEGVDVQRMFTLSYRKKANGTGVGLSISRSIIEAHGAL
jgi:nitrogen fixation/metabolism regulation signal transduction histidine kinase